VLTNTSTRKKEHGSGRPPKPVADDGRQGTERDLSRHPRRDVLPAHGCGRWCNRQGLRVTHSSVSKVEAIFSLLCKVAKMVIFFYSDKHEGGSGHRAMKTTATGRFQRGQARCRGALLLSSQFSPIPSMSRGVINIVKQRLSHPFSRIKSIDQWAVDPDPFLTLNTSARIGKTAIKCSNARKMIRLWCVSQK